MADTFAPRAMQDPICDLLTVLKVLDCAHLVLSGMSYQLLQNLAAPLAACLNVTRLSLGTAADLPHTLSIFQYFPKLAKYFKRIDRIELYPEVTGSSSYNSAPAISWSNDAALQPARESVPATSAGLFALDFSVLLDLEGLAIIDEEADVDEIEEWQVGHPASPEVYSSVSFFVPTKFQNQWKEWDIRELDISKYRALQISGGRWKLAGDVYAPFLERLSCKHIWKLVCRHSERYLPRLASVELSLQPDGTTKWGDIARFLTSMLVPSIKSISITFPTSSRDGVQHDSVNAAWQARVSEMHQLTEIILVNYIPATLSFICGNGDCRWSIRKSHLPMIYCHETS